VIAATVVSLVLLGGSASASLPGGGGPGGGETINCSYASSIGWTESNNLGSATVTGPPGGCYGNKAGFYMSLAGSTCNNATWEAYVFANGAGSAWFHQGGYCANGNWNYSSSYSGGNTSQGVQLHLLTTCSTCTTTVNYGIAVYKH
jgi:hypothetical protein